MAAVMNQMRLPRCSHESKYGVEPNGCQRECSECGHLCAEHGSDVDKHQHGCRVPDCDCDGFVSGPYRS